MEINKIEKDSLREIIHNDLRKKIVKGEILPGKLFTTRYLSDQFGVSIIPVREALMQLQKEGIVKLNKKGFQFNALTMEEFKEIYYIRFLLEPEISKKACKARPDSAVEELEKIFSEMREAANSREYNEKNQEFHFYIYSYANSPILLNIINTLWARIGPYLYMASSKENMKKGMELHNDIFKAFKLKNELEIMTNIKRDLELSFSLLEKIIENPF